VIKFSVEKKRFKKIKYILKSYNISIIYLLLLNKHQYKNLLGQSTKLIILPF